MDRVPRLVGDVEAALEDDLHLVVVVCINKRGSFLQAIEPGGYGLLWVFVLSVAGISYSVYNT